VTSTTPRRDPSSTPASGSTVGAPRRVVIAEDEASARADLAQLLTAEGFTVVGQAADGDQAVALATALRPDLVLMNARLPHTDGITATATLTAARIAPVVILTGAGQPPAAPRARDAGAMTAVRRPFSRANPAPGDRDVHRPVRRNRRPARTGRRPHPAARGPEGRRTRQGAGHGPAGDDRTGRLPLAPADRGGTPHIHLAGRRRDHRQPQHRDRGRPHHPTNRSINLNHRGPHCAGTCRRQACTAATGTRSGRPRRGGHSSPRRC